MEYISSFIYCDSIQTEITPQGPQTQIVKPLQILMPVSIPSNYSFAVACSLCGFEPEKENYIRMQFVSPSNQIIFDTNNINFKIPDEELKVRKSATMQFHIDLRNLVFREDGVYCTKVYVNEKFIGEYKIEVMAGE